MTFDEACAACPPGQYFKSATSGWNEYNCQYGRHPDGKLFWTAGMTAGGDLTPKLRSGARRFEDYEIFKYWKDHFIYSPEYQREREERETLAREATQDAARTQFLETVNRAADDAASMAIALGVPRRTADKVVTGLTKDFLHILDGDSNHPGYRLSERLWEVHPDPDSIIQVDISGSLEHYFDEINS